MELRDKESDVLSRLREGDHAAFNTVYRNYYAALCTYATKFIDLEDAENVVEELMIWVWENRAHLRIDSSMSQYLLKATYHRVINFIVKKKIVAKTEAQFYVRYVNPAIVTGDYELNELIRKIEVAVEELPSPYREAFVMHRFRDMTYREIAKRCGVSPQTVNYRITQSLKLLRIALKEYLPLWVLFF